MIAPFFAFGVVHYWTDIRFPESLYLIVGFTTAVWLSVTALTRPTAQSTLVEFFRRVHPGGWWKPVAQEIPGVEGDSGAGSLILCWAAGVVLVYAALFGTGKLVLGETGAAILLYGLAITAGIVIYASLGKRGWGAVSR